MTINDCGKDVKIDLKHLKDPIEFGGLKVLIDILRGIQHEYSILIIDNYKNGGSLDDDFECQLLYLKILSEAFEKIREDAIRT